MDLSPITSTKRFTVKMAPGFAPYLKGEGYVHSVVYPAGNSQQLNAPQAINDKNY